MEHTDYLKQKKKKKQCQKRFWMMMLLLLMAAGIGMFVYQKQQKQAEQTDPNVRENVVLQENQSWLILQIENIIGNEIEAAKVQMKAVSEKRGSEWETVGETKLYQIPVGTQVVTRLGSVTTFSRLASGDVIYCLTEQVSEKTEILKIWIEE